MLVVRRPDTKRQHYEQLLDKLRIMFDVAYGPGDFAALRIFKLNSDQLLSLLRSSNFLENANKQYVVDCLKHLQKAR